MPRKNLYLSDKALEVLPRLAKESDMSVSAYASQLILDAAAKKAESIEAMREELERLRRAENENGKNVTALLEMLNTYFKMFATSDANQAAFFSIDEQPHPWTRKALEVGEAKIRMARYGKVKGSD